MTDDMSDVFDEFAQIAGQKPRSVQSVVTRLLSTTLLFKHIERVPISECTPDIRYLGQVFFDEGDDYAVSRLLAALDEALFFGPSPWSADRSITGLLSTDGVRHYEKREEFYDAVNNLPGALNFKLFRPTPPSFVQDGDLPPIGEFTFAIQPDALVWRQLLPATVIELCSVREGLFTRSMAPGPPRTFKHESSKERKRSVAVMYGNLIVTDPSKIIVLAENRG